MALQTGTLLKNNSYRIRSTLGQGGFGVVYLAEDLILQRLCAMKESFENSPEAQAQFEVEARLLASLSHPHLPRVTDNFIEGRSGKQYLVMEYIEGSDLGQLLLQQGPLPEDQVRLWFDQVLDAVAYLHTNKPNPIIHRDIKPDNLRLLPGGKMVKLVDFGIAKIGAKSRTANVARGITPGYSPPEQYGSGTDTYSDVYALGATLYNLLTGVIPPDAIDRNYQKTILTPPRQINPAISVEMEQIILTAMNLDPAQRFADASQMRHALLSRRSADLVICPNCGALARAGSQFCSQCGRSLTETGPFSQLSRLIERLEKLIIALKQKQKSLQGSLAQLQSQVQYALGQKNWDQTQALAVQIKQLEQESLEAQQQIQQYSRITALVNAARQALMSEDWQMLDKQISEAAQIGQEGQDAAGMMTAWKAMKQREAEQRSTLLRQIQAVARAGIHQERWDQVADMLQQLRALGEKGQEEANRLQAEMTSARQQAQNRDEKILQFNSVASLALQEENWAQVTEAIQWLHDLGPKGEVEADRLEAEMQRIQKAAQQRDEKIQQLGSAIQGVILLENWNAIENNLVQLRSLGKNGQLQASRWQAEADIARKKAQERDINIDQLTIKFQAFLQQEKWPQAQEALAQIGAFGAAGQSRAKTLESELQLASAGSGNIFGIR
jgi:serine/threonine-protein kinase